MKALALDGAMTYDIGSPPKVAPQISRTLEVPAGMKASARFYAARWRRFYSVGALRLPRSPAYRETCRRVRAARQVVGIGALSSKMKE